MTTREEIMRRYNPDWRPVEGSERAGPNPGDEIKQRYAKSWGEGVKHAPQVPAAQQKEPIQYPTSDADFAGSKLESGGFPVDSVEPVSVEKK